MKQLLPIAIIVLTIGCVAKTKPLWIFYTSQPVTGAAIIEENVKRIAVLTRDDIIILNAETGQKIQSAPTRQQSAYAIKCLSSMCFIGGGIHERGFLSTFDVEKGEIRTVVDSDSIAAIYDIDFGPSETFATAQGDETVTLWNLEQMKPLKTLTIEGGLEVYALCFFNGNILAGNDRGELILWDGQSKSPIKSTAIESSAILTLAATGNLVLVGGYGYLDFFDSEIKKKIQHIEFERAAVLTCDLAPNGVSAWCGLSNGMLVCVGIDGKLKMAMKIDSKEIRFVKVLNNIVITASSAGTVKAWELSKLLSTSQ